ncbi:hypothetical protein FRC06_009006 [Ceratobasidium sp. 370]|nr:hypothetical protein FRC06_009006 [Ceratobasidium sp. 370]
MARPSKSQGKQPVRSHDDDDNDDDAGRKRRERSARSAQLHLLQQRVKRAKRARRSSSKKRPVDDDEDEDDDDYEGDGDSGDNDRDKAGPMDVDQAPDLEERYAALMAEVTHLRALVHQRHQLDAAGANDTPGASGSGAAAHDATPGPPEIHPIPDKKATVTIERLRQLMGLLGEEGGLRWLEIRADIRDFVTRFGLNLGLPWKQQDKTTLASLYAMVRKRTPELNKFANNWGAEYLVQETFNHRRSHWLALQKRRQLTATPRAAGAGSRRATTAPRSHSAAENANPDAPSPRSASPQPPRGSPTPSDDDAPSSSTGHAGDRPANPSRPSTSARSAPISAGPAPNPARAGSARTLPTPTRTSSALSLHANAARGSGISRAATSANGGGSGQADNTAPPASARRAPRTSAPAPAEPANTLRAPSPRAPAPAPAEPYQTRAQTRAAAAVTSAKNSASTSASASAPTSKSARKRKR